MKRWIPLVVSVAMVWTVATPPLRQIYAKTDNLIFTDPVNATYIGREDGYEMIRSLNFDDVPTGHWAKEAIARTGALNMVKGDDANFRPDNAVSNEEAIAFVLRAIDMEDEALELAAQEKERLPFLSAYTTQEVWSIGYLRLARDIGIITPDEYYMSLLPKEDAQEQMANFVSQGLLNNQDYAEMARVASTLPEGYFYREESVLKEDLVAMAVKALRYVDEDAFTNNGTKQNLFNFPDWDELDIEDVAYMEDALKAGLIHGDGYGELKPKGKVKRSEMVQILKNMGDTYNRLAGITKKSGTIGGIKDGQSTRTGSGELTRDFYIRDENGKMDLLQFIYNRDLGPEQGIYDVVVYKDGVIGGMALLSEGDEVEYLVRDVDRAALYVQVVGNGLKIEQISGVLSKIDVSAGTLTLKDASGKLFTYQLSDGLYGTEDNESYVFFDERKRNVKSIPIGSRVELTLKNEIVDNIQYLGETTLITEQRGIVIENNPDMGYLSYIDSNGNEVVKNYYENDMLVKKKQYYDEEDEIGYIDQIFPNFKYNPMETEISNVEAGDIVFMRFSPDDPDTITQISASTNYQNQYGQIKEFTVNGDTVQMLFEYENKQTAWFEIPSKIFISKEGRPIDISDVQVGDWANILVNRAILEAGNFIESVKEMALEGDNHYVSAIIKGQLAGINAIQNQLQVQNAQTLDGQRWTNYKNVAQFSLVGKDIEYYLDGERISLDLAARQLKRSNGEVYIALENNYSGEKVKKVTFRTGRDELLAADHVINSNGNGSFAMASVNGDIATDAGTIVRRNGRLVQGGNIEIPDYAVVSLNGGNYAAVVDISKPSSTTPMTLSTMFVRGRIKSVDENKSFTLKSMAILEGEEWQYTPIEREYAIDYNTKVLTADGISSADRWIGYTDQTVADKVYHIVTDGSRAEWIVDIPFSEKSIRGTIYAVTDTGISLKDVTYYDNESGKWESVSDVNATAIVTIPTNSTTAKDGEVVSKTQLKVGNQVKVMTNSLPNRISPGFTVNGYIIFVEK